MSIDLAVGVGGPVALSFLQQALKLCICAKQALNHRPSFGLYRNAPQLTDEVTTLSVRGEEDKSCVC